MSLLTAGARPVAPVLSVDSEDCPRPSRRASGAGTPYDTFRKEDRPGCHILPLQSTSPELANRRRADLVLCDGASAAIPSIPRNIIAGPRGHVALRTIHLPSQSHVFAPGVLVLPRRVCGPHDDRFRWSPSFAWLAILGMVFVWIGVTALILALSTFVLYLGLGLLVIGAVQILVGAIGTLVGLWRLGVRYNESMFEVGAILTLLPVLSIGGQLPVLFGAARALSRLQNHWIPPVVDRVPTLE